jgi:phosphate transport system substrate-binding protein
MAEIGKGFEAQHPDVRVDVQAGGTSRGIQDARSGLAAIGMASRALQADEQDLMAFIIAQGGIAMIVHASNPLAGIGCGCVLDSGPAEQLFASVRDSLAHRYLNGMLC